MTSYRSGWLLGSVSTEHNLTPLQLWVQGNFENACFQQSEGHEINFFSDSHLAPKFFKVVANSKKVGRHFQRQTKSFFTLSAF